MFKAPLIIEHILLNGDSFKELALNITKQAAKGIFSKTLILNDKKKFHQNFIKSNFSLKSRQIY